MPPNSTPLRLVTLAGVVAVTVPLAVSWGAPPAGASAAIVGSTRRRLLAIAERAAQSVGDDNPEWITVVATTRARALTSATPGSCTGDANEPVYLITIKGAFTANDAPGQPLAKAPTGMYLSIVLDAGTLQGTDWGVSEHPPTVPPSSLGPVTYLKDPSRI